MGIPIMETPFKISSRTLIEDSQPPTTPHTRPMTPAPFKYPTPTQSRSSKWAALSLGRAHYGRVLQGWTGLVDPQARLGQVREELD